MVYGDIYSDLRRQALGWIVILIGAGTWICLLLVNLRSHRLPTEWISGAVITVSICGVLYFLRDKYLRPVCYITVVCMWLGNLILAFYLPQPFLYLFGVVIVLSSSLIKLSATVIFTVITTILMVILTGGQVLPLGPIINLWGSLIASVVASRGLYQVLETINRHHDYSIEQMNLARDHRAQLVKLTKALQEATERLRHGNIQLRYARAAADEARRLKAQFAANVSHELRTPINLVIGYSEVMVTAPEIYGAPLPPAYRSDIQAIYRNAKHLQDLINDILDISQIEASRLAINKEKTDLLHTLFEAVGMANDLVVGKGLQFSVELPDQLPEVRIDRTRIRQVLLNLLANAVRFTDKGAITLRACQHNDEIIVSVADTGVGIAAADLNHVFEEFYQAENPLSKKQGGTGLGLTLSMKVVQQHGGRLWAESEGAAGRGSTFSFTIPLSAGDQPIIDHPVPAARHNPQCVIIFDEEVAVGQLFKRYLDKHEVIFSQSQDDLIHLTQTIQPSAVVLDCNRRDQDFEALLADHSHDTAIIFCPMPSRRHALQVYGAADYLVKPVTRQTLINAIAGLQKPVRKILVVDDERDVTRMLSRMIAAYDQHCVILQANNGKDALAMMYREHPDVVLLDLQMPEMDGFQIIRHMKHDPLLQYIPVIIASARGAEEDKTSAVEGEITVIRSNGFSPVELVSCVESVVNVLIPSIAPMPPEN